MSIKPIFFAGLTTVLLGAVPTALSAETFAVKLGNTSLGQLTYSDASNQKVIKSTLANTPLGVFNGTFLGTSRRDRAADGSNVQQFEGISRSSRKSRDVQVQIGAGRAVATSVTPASEVTALSTPTSVPKGVVDPVVAIGLLMSASGCPKAIRIYDGRRAIALLPAASKSQDGKLICDVYYKVTHGPGHLSPLSVSNAKMRVTYDLGTNGQEISQIRLGSGVFNLVLERMK